MAQLKITTWNIEHLGKLLPGTDQAVLRRKRAIAQEIQQIHPDILCMVEGPGNLLQLQDWVQDATDGLGGAYQIPLIPGTQEILNTNPPNPRAALQGLYQMQGTNLTGNQWIWFLVQTDLFNASGAVLQDPAVWQAVVGRKTWEVNYWGDMKASRHQHWRHPQVLKLTVAGGPLECIGIHMKSKINTISPFEPDGTTLKPSYVQEAIKARIKLATEAVNLRQYIEGRFAQEPDPLILVMGDANDGPGKEFFETQYLFFDLISNLQGEVFFARRFLNHCLFDYEDRLRWSTRFKDRVEPDRPPEMLLDHILFTQGLVNAATFPQVEPHAGQVEHVVHETVNALLVGSDTSDHRPVSVEVTVS